MSFPQLSKAKKEITKFNCILPNIKSSIFFEKLKEVDANKEQYHNRSCNGYYGKIRKTGLLSVPKKICLDANNDSENSF